MKKILIALMLSVFASTASAEIVTSVIDYEADGVPLKGYLAYDDSVSEKRPGILVVHEWWGHNDYVRRRAEKLAALGYVAFALDMYGGGKTAEHPSDAGAFSKQAMENMDLYKAKFLAALDVLKAQDMVNTDDIGAIGYCFGGSTVLNMARMGVDIDGVVSFHGGLTPAVESEPGDIEAKILVCHGAADAMITDENVQTFKAEMDQAEADYTFMSYEGATHSFTNPAADELGEKYGIPVSYNAEADQKSWNDMKNFFDKIFTD